MIVDVLKTLTQQIVKSLIKPREESSHKGTYGHALLVAGVVLVNQRGGAIGGENPGEEAAHDND